MSRLELKGALAEKRQRNYEVITEAKGLARSIADLLGASVYRPLSELKVKEAAAMMERLDALYEEHVTLQAEITDIERELA